MTVQVERHVIRTSVYHQQRQVPHQPAHRQHQEVLQAQRQVPHHQQVQQPQVHLHQHQDVQRIMFLVTIVASLEIVA